MIPHYEILRLWAWVILTMVLAFCSNLSGAAPIGATIDFQGNSQFPASIVKISVTHPGGPTFSGSNGKLERGTPLSSLQVESGATFYRCDSVTGFPQPFGNRPPINRLGASSFIAIKELPNGTNKVWINAAVGAWRITDGSIISDWEYQIRYYFDGTNKSISAGIIPNSGFYGGSPAEAVATVHYRIVKFKIENFSWDKLLGGLNFRISVDGIIDAGAETAAHVYWAKGETLADRLGDKPIFSLPIKSDFTGKSQLIHVPGAVPNPAESKLWHAPKGTTHLLLAVDPEDKVSAPNQSKYKAIPDVQLEYAVDVDRSRVSSWTLDSLKDIYRVAGQKVGHINSLLRTPEEQALIMFKQSLDKSISSYGAGGAQVLEVYKTMTAGLKRKQILAKQTEIVGAMVLKIKSLIANGVKISNHLADQCKQNAVDVGRNWIGSVYGETGRKRFVESVCADLRLSRLGGPLPLEGCAEFKDPTYHLDYTLPKDVSDACTAALPKRSAESISTVAAKRLTPTAGLTSIDCDLASGSAIVRGSVTSGRFGIRFQAFEGDIFSARLGIIETLLGLELSDDDSMVFVFDEMGRLVASNDDEEFDTLTAAIESFRIPVSGLYTLVVTTFPNSPIFDPVDGGVQWLDAGLSGIVFDAELLLVSSPPRLRVSSGQSGSYFLHWPEGVLESAVSVDGPWHAEEGAESPYSMIDSGIASFYRLKLP